MTGYYALSSKAVFIIKIYSRRISYETKTKEIRKKAAELFAYAGDGYRAAAGYGYDGMHMRSPTIKVMCV